MDKDIRFSDKKIDESWKDQASRDRSVKPNPSDKTNPKAAPEAKTSKIFLNFATSLGIQAMMFLGEIPNPETNQSESNLDAAREIVDLLIQLKEKTQGNLSAEERHFFDNVLPELQLKFAQKI